MNAFTAAQIASALGKSPRLVRRALACVRADGECTVRGNITAVWKIESLPAKLQTELSAAAKARGLASVLELFSQAKPWTPEIPWRDVCPEHQSEAVKTQRALLPVLERHRSPILENSELVEIGLRNYAREFGKEISPERWRYLFNRTLDRAQDSEQFSRPELFLPGNVRRAVTTDNAKANDPAFDSLCDCVGRFRDPLAPTIDEHDALWQEAVELFREQAGDAPKKFKRRLLDFLWQRAPFLAKSANALRVNFDRKWFLVNESNGDALALLDGRHLKLGEQRADAIPQTDVDLIAWHSARNCGGRTAQAVRELAQQGEKSGLSPQTLELIRAPHANKSHVPRRLFSAVHRDVKLIAPYLLGKKAVDDATAALRRDYENLSTMDVLTADDFTMPVYCFVPDGKWWALTRGQVLLMIDCRSLKIIGWSLQPERNYNSLVIRTLMNRTCRQWGLPRAWLFENGIWRNSRLVKGSAPREWNDARSDAELKPGWEKLGVRFIHAKRARSKPAELVGGLLQNLMERVPGYCGRDERRDCPELTKRNKLAVEARRIEPHGHFLSFDGWSAELEKLICHYNAQPQQGEILGGLSPDAAFETHWPKDNPPTALDSTCWHLLAHWVSEREVKANGIEFRIGAEKFIYRDENSAALRAQKVFAWFDPECPELLGVTDLNGRNPVLVRRENKVGFLASLDRDGVAGREFQDELSKVAAHNAYPKARYTILKAKFQPNFRKNLASPATFETAITFTSQRHDHETEQKEAKRQRAQVSNRAQKLGLPAALVRSADAQTAEGLEMMARAEREMHDEETEPTAAAAPKQTKKIYVLKPFTPEGENK